MARELITSLTDRPTAHGGKKEDGGEDKRVSSEHGFGTSLGIQYMIAPPSPLIHASSRLELTIQAVTERPPLRLAGKVDRPATTTAV